MIDDPDVRPPDRRLPGPEAIAAVLAIAMLALLGSTITAGSGGLRPGASGGPAPNATPGAPTAPPVLDPSIVLLLEELNLQLAEHGRSLERAVAAEPFRVSDVAATIRRINALANVGADNVRVLGDGPADDDIGARMGTAYATLTQTATDALAASIANESAYKVAAGVLVDLIAELPGLQAELVRIAAARPSPSPSAGPDTSVAPSPGTPGPSGPTPSAAPGEQIVDGGFELGVGQPWVFSVAPGSAAELRADAEEPAQGSAAARVEISLPSSAFSGISLHQDGLVLAAGARYTVSVRLRAAAPREVRIHVASSVGASYLTRVATIDTDWMSHSFTFTAPVSDERALLEIDLGRSAATTWIDSVSLAPVRVAAP